MMDYLIDRYFDICDVHFIIYYNRQARDRLGRKHRPSIKRQAASKRIYDWCTRQVYRMREMYGWDGAGL